MMLDKYREYIFLESQLDKIPNRALIFILLLGLTDVLTFFLCAFEPSMLWCFLLSGAVTLITPIPLLNIVIRKTDEILHRLIELGNDEDIRRMLVRRAERGNKG